MDVTEKKRFFYQLPGAGAGTDCGICIIPINVPDCPGWKLSMFLVP